MTEETSIRVNLLVHDIEWDAPKRHKLPRSCEVWFVADNIEQYIDRSNNHLTENGVDAVNDLLSNETGYCTLDWAYVVRSYDSAPSLPVR